MNIEPGPLDGLLIITPRILRDERGFFIESYHQQRFHEAGIDLPWPQDNHVFSVADTVRGMHFQWGEGQAKLVRCIRGRFWDVAVDIRPASPTFGHWFGLELDAESGRTLFIPSGFAHGYAVPWGDAEVVYKCSSLYDPALEGGFNWSDPEVGIEWPVRDPILSQRDLHAQSFAQCMEGQKRDGIE